MIANSGFVFYQLGYTRECYMLMPPRTNQLNKVDKAHQKKQHSRCYSIPTKKGRSSQTRFTDEGTCVQGCPSREGRINGCRISGL